MNTQMGSALPSEKLDRNNFASWEYKMHQYLVGQGYWGYIKGAQENRVRESFNFPKRERVVVVNLMKREGDSI